MVHRSRSLTTSLGQTSFRTVLAICAPFSTQITSMEKQAYAKEEFSEGYRIAKINLTDFASTQYFLIIGTCGTSSTLL